MRAEDVIRAICIVLFAIGLCKQFIDFFDEF